MEVDNFNKQKFIKKVEDSNISDLNEIDAVKLLLCYIMPSNKNINNVAKTLIEKFGTYHEIMDAKEEDLVGVGGMTPINAKSLSLIKQIRDYYFLEKSLKTTQLCTTQERIDFFKGFMKYKSQEEFFIVGLSKNNTIKDLKKLASGKPDFVVIERKDISNFISKTSVKRVIVCHNHPNASCEPSKHDDDCTNDLIMWLNSTGVELIDHIIVGNDGCFSFNEIKIYN